MGSSGDNDIEISYVPQSNPLYDEYYQQVLQGIKTGIKPYRGKLVAPLTELEEAGLAGIGALGQTDQSNIRRALAGNLLTEDLPFEVGPEAYQSYFNTAVEPIARRNFEDVIQQILHRTASGGPSGAARADLGDALTNFELGLSAQRSAVGLQGAERRQDLMMQNRALLPALMSASRTEEAFGPAMQVQAGGYQRGIDQANLNAKFLKWQMEQAYNNPWLGHIQAAGGGVSPTALYSGGGGVSPWLSMIPATGGFLEGISSFF